MGLWHALVVLPAATLFSQWDLGMAREWLGCVLLALSAGKMETVSDRRVERSARYGLVVALGKALRGVDSDHDHHGVRRNAIPRYVGPTKYQLPRFGTASLVWNTIRQQQELQRR